MNINEHYSNILKIISSNKRLENIKSGDTVKYSVMRHIEGNRFLINIMGKKIVAEIKGENIKESSLAKVISTDREGLEKKLILTVVENEDTVKISKYKSDSTITKHLSKESDKAFVAMLNDRGIKADNKNIDYIKTVMKYMPNLGESEKSLVFSFISKSIYLNIYELTNIFEGKLYSYIKANKANTEDNFKKTNINLAYADKLKKAIYKLFIVSSFNEMKDFIDNNGYFNLLFMIFDSIHTSDESDEAASENKELEEFINLFLRIVSNNRKNASLRENVYFFMVPFVFEDKVKEINVFINEDRESRDLSILFKDVSDGNSLFEIKIIKNLKHKNVYKIETYFFDEELYKKFNESKYSVLENIQNICLKDNITIEAEIIQSVTL